MQVHYDPEANILSLELGAGEIAYGKEVNGAVIHLTSSNVPVLIEILNASSFFAKFSKLKERGSAIKPVPSPSGG